MLDSAEWCENVHQFGLVAPCAQPEDSDDSRFVRVLAGSVVASAAIVAGTSRSGSSDPSGATVRPGAVIASSSRVIFSRTAA